MNKPDLYKLNKTDFIDELIRMYKEQEISKRTDLMGFVREYSDESDNDYNEIIRVVYEELENQGL